MTFQIARDVRKATRSDRFYMPGTVYYSRFWTPSRDDFLEELCGLTHFSDICERLGADARAVRDRMALLGLKCLGVAEAKSPTRGEWVGTVIRMAAEAGMTPIPVLAGATYRLASRVRAKAWAAILDENPHYTVAGVARVSGHDHSTALTALKKIGWKRKSVECVSTQEGK